jgi:hypothetical protein
MRPPGRSAEPVAGWMGVLREVFKGGSSLEWVGSTEGSQSGMPHRGGLLQALIVEEGWTTGALAACRALAEGGWIVGIGSPQRGGIASASRACSRWHRIPSPTCSFGSFIAATAEAVDRFDYDIVFGAGDAELLALSLGRDRLNAVVPYPAHDVVVKALDKLSLCRRAAEAGLAAPRTVEATADALASISGRTVIKARLHTTPGGDHVPARLEATIVGTSAEAEARAAVIRAAGGQPLIQDFVEGTLLIYTAVVDETGDVVCRVQHEAERIWPPGAGFSCRAMTRPVDADLERKLTALLRSAGWIGLAQFQLLVPPGGEPHVIDFNGRFYASMESARAAGVNFPLAWASVFIDGARSDAVGADTGRPGLRYQWLEGDLSRALLERRGGLFWDLLDCLAVAPGAHHAVWRIEDPVPALRSVGHLLRQAGRKLVQSVMNGRVTRGSG